MSDPTNAAEVRAAIRGNKRLEQLVVHQVRLMQHVAHARDTAESGARVYDDDLFPDAVDIVKAYRQAKDIIDLSPDES